MLWGNLMNVVQIFVADLSGIAEIASENYRNNIPEKLAVVQKKHKTGILLANFLLSATVDGKRIDYLKAYVELL